MHPYSLDVSENGPQKTLVFMAICGREHDHQPSCFLEYPMFRQTQWWCFLLDICTLPCGKPHITMAKINSICIQSSGYVNCNNALFSFTGTIRLISPV